MGTQDTLLKPTSLTRLSKLKPLSISRLNSPMNLGVKESYDTQVMQHLRQKKNKFMKFALMAFLIHMEMV